MRLSELQNYTVVAPRNLGVQDTEGRFDDVGQDLRDSFLGVGEDLTRRGENITDTVRATVAGEQSFAEMQFQGAGQILGGAGDIIGRGIQAVASPFLSQSEEDALTGAVSNIINSTGAVDAFNALPERSQRNIGAAGGFAEFLGFKGAGGVANKGARAALNKSDEVLSNSRARVANTGFSRNSLGQTLNNIRFQLSDIDPQAQNVLSRSNPDEVNRYFQQARNAKADPTKPTPLELAGNRAEEAYDVIDEALTNANRGKKAIINDVATKKMSEAGLLEFKTNANDSIRDRFGVEFDTDGSLKVQEGRAARLDATDERLVREYFTRLNALGSQPSLKQVDDFIDWAQSQLYKQNKSLSQLDAADRAVVADLKQLTGQLNGQLKNEVGGGYAEVNARISHLLDMQDELSRALGPDGKKGGSLMKRLFSPTGGGTRQMFELIKQETGIDLAKEATLAKFVMESVGDDRQRSLLQRLDIVVQGASELDLTRPLSWYNFLRERADLDGQDLANEIIRRSNDSSR